MKKQIPIVLALILVLIMSISLCSYGSSEESVPVGDPTQSAVSVEEDVTIIQEKVGMLTLLNMTEEEAEALYNARSMAIEQNIRDAQETDKVNDIDKKKVKYERQIFFFDTLDTMLMALDVGIIDNMNVFYSSAQYLCANNDDLVMRSNKSPETETVFSKVVDKGLLNHDFSFMMTQDNEALRDEFNEAIAAMKEDGTLDKLVKEQIDASVEGIEITPVEMPAIDGVETVKVAVTGSLPPMDYISADGTPAGFNTAVLAEISNRINKNIELVELDSGARATALASGQVDAVFWTRTSDVFNKRAEQSEEEIQVEREEIQSGMTDEQIKTKEAIDATIDLNSLGKLDTPEGTIITESYFSDTVATVRKK